jgi:hypothetical protein
MGKTISLKLTSQEKNIIDSMRNKGISPSHIFREALWKYFNEKEPEILEKPYKEVNLENEFLKEKEKIDDRNVYNMVNPHTQKVNLENNFLQEKEVYHEVNRDNQVHDSFLDQYVYQLHRQIQQLNRELQDWKTQYAAEIKYWKNAYQSLQTEYQHHVTDSTQRIDDRFNQIMFYIDESRKTTSHTFEISHSEEGDLHKKTKKKWTSHNVRM